MKSTIKKNRLILITSNKKICFKQNKLLAYILNIAIFKTLGQKNNDIFESQKTSKCLKKLTAYENS